MISCFIKKENSYTLFGISCILFLLFLISPLLNFALSKLPDLSGDSSFLISRLYYWLCLLLLYMYCALAEKKNFLLWEEKDYRLTFYFFSFISLFLFTITGLLIIKGLLVLSNVQNDSNHLSNLLGRLRVNKPLLFFTAITAGIVEELIFRGYLQPRFEILFKNTWISIILTSALFGLLHYGYGTVYNVLGPLFLGLLFSMYYHKYRNLKLLILFHFSWDVLALFVAKPS